jgi:hypothetical protein
MYTSRSHFTGRSWTVWALGATLVTVGTWAVAKPVTSDIQARYLQERALCLNGQSNQDRITCLKEAGAARAEAIRGSLDNGGAAAYERNARSRCERVSAPDRQACVSRMDGQGTTTGSVAAGGIYRELVTREVGTPNPAPPDSPTKPQ